MATTMAAVWTHSAGYGGQVLYAKLSKTRVLFAPVGSLVPFCVYLPKVVSLLPKTGRLQFVANTDSCGRADGSLIRH